MFLRFALIASLLLQSSYAFAANIQREIFPLERNAVQLHLERYQTDGEGEKRPLLLVHGLTYSSHEFDVNYGDYSLARFFADNGYAVWLLDIAGYGSSQKVTDGFIPNSDYAAEDIAAAAKLIAETSKTENLDVLGWSWGTVTAGRFAAKYPNLVKKLVLYAPIIMGRGKADVAPFNKNTWAHAASDFQVKADKSIDYDIVDPAVADTFLSNCWRYDGDSSPNGGRRDLRVDPGEQLIPVGDIKSPTLLILGSNDYVVTVPICEEALKELPKGSELKVIEGAAHAMMMEKPYYKNFRESVLEFLKK
jgi:pimeloyl-ACP methyl ester carboxylesterase